MLLLLYMQIRVFLLERYFSPKTIEKSAPSPKDHLLTFSAPFQWIDLPESETLVSQSTRSTRKKEYQKYQKYQITIGTKKPEY
jgi:hypothetical protein